MVCYEILSVHFAQLNLQSSKFFRVLLCEYGEQGKSCRLIIDESGMVYDDAEALYAEVRKVGEELLDEAFNVLCPKSFSQPQAWLKATNNHGGDILVFNTTPFPRTDVVKFPLSTATSQLDSKVVQKLEDGKTGYAVIVSQAGGSLCDFIEGPTAFTVPASGLYLLPS
jgi:hypothetical protein